jgi:hypothetical protein
MIFNAWWFYVLIIVSKYDVPNFIFPLYGKDGFFEYYFIEMMAKYRA